MHGKKSNWNEHPKKPHPATMEDLTIPFVQQKAETKRQKQGLDYNPINDGKADFYSKVKSI